MKFTRKNKDSFGSYGLSFNGEQVKIAGRDIYDTDDKKLIEVMKGDSELVAVGGRKKERPE